MCLWLDILTGMTFFFFFLILKNLKHANPSLSCWCVAALRWSSVSLSTIWWNIDHSCGAVWIWDTHTHTHTDSYFRNQIYSEAGEGITGQFLLQPKKQLCMFWQILSLAFFSSLYFVLFSHWLPWRHSVCSEALEVERIMGTVTSVI